MQSLTVQSPLRTVTVYCTRSHTVFIQVFIKGRTMWIRQIILSLWANIRSSIFISSSRNTKFLEILNLIFFPCQASMTIFLFIEQSKIYLATNKHFSSLQCLKGAHMTLSVPFTALAPMSKLGVWGTVGVLHLALR